MKKNLLLAGAFLTLGFASNAQWVTQNTAFAKAARGISGIYMVDANTVWAIAFSGNGGTAPLMEYTKTSNGGTTWMADSVKGAPVGDALASICAISKDTAWASVFGNGTTVGGIYRTNNGGTTWTNQSSAAYNASSFPDWVYFFDKNHGVSFGDPNTVGASSVPHWEIYTTSNGGTNWVLSDSTKTPPILSGEYGNANGYAVAGGVLYAGTNMGQVLKSTDMGVHWTATTASAAMAPISNIAFKDANNGLATIYGTTKDSIYATTNGGTTWTKVAKTGRYLHSGLCYSTMGGGMYISTGASTGMYGTSFSTDNGMTWKTQDTANQHLAVAFMGTTGWTGGFNTSSTVGGIYKWTGSAFAIEEQHVAYEAGLSVYPNPNNGMFQIALSNFSGKTPQLAVYDLLGNVVFQSSENVAGNLFLKDVDLSSYSTGMYIVRVVDGAKVYTAKVVRQ